MGGEDRLVLSCSNALWHWSDQNVFHLYLEH